MVIRNFLFHRVSNEPDLMWPPMKPSLFSEIISHLTRKFSVVPLEHYLDNPGDFQSKRNLATVLFDDGYKDNIEMAVPILSQHKCPASFYVVTDCIDNNIPTWTYIIDNVILKTKKQRLELGYDFVPEKYKSLLLKLNDLSNPEVKEVKPWLKKLPNPQRLLIIRSILSQCDDVQMPDNKMMNWNDIRQLDSDGFIIGSHSHTHPMLASLQNESEITEELKLSAQRIQQELGKNPQTISYPVGSYDERVVNLSVQEGYQYGLAVKQQFFSPGKDNVFKIPRVELYQEPWWKVHLRINGIYSRLKKIWPGEN
jgi:peptidoglycan/xylan/chitin deacetylase (PgdA/CDA1 family)